MHSLFLNRLAIRAITPVVAFGVVLFTASEPAYPALNCNAAASAIDGSAAACNITLSATVVGSIALAVTGGATPATNMPAQTVAFSTIDPNCTNTPATGGCTAIGTGEGSHVYAHLAAALTYTGCSGGTGTLGLTLDAAGTWPGAVRFQANTTSANWGRGSR